MSIYRFISNVFIGVAETIKLVLSFIAMYPEKRIATKLVKNALTVSVAESCTGGLISSRLTDISGSSVFINENFTTYSNEAKIKYLNVSKETINNYGAVSEQTAYEMSKGLLANAGCDIALSTTGIAGPTGGSEGKPVGLIYIGISSNNKSETIKFQANKFLPRRIMKFVFSQVSLLYLYRFLKNNY